jgi:hypothetical protein
VPPPQPAAASAAPIAQGTPTRRANGPDPPTAGGT